MSYQIIKFLIELKNIIDSFNSNREFRMVKKAKQMERFNNISRSGALCQMNFADIYLIILPVESRKKCYFTKYDFNNVQEYIGLAKIP